MNEESKLTQYDDFLKDDSAVAAIVIREELRPVQGDRGVFCPPTFAPIGSGKSDYQIDWFGPQPKDPEAAQNQNVIANRCTVDSVPSQANRLEARLLKHSGTLIPKVTITGSRVGQGSLDLLEVGHRVGDAVLRYSKKEDKDGFEPFEEALRAFVKGDAGRLAQLAPTSLVFGHWDSRDSATKKSTKSKARRLIRSEIVAYNVQKVTKRSQYWSSIDPEVSQELEQILKEAKAAAQEDPKTKNAASQLGMTDVPVPESPGGVIAFGSIERTTIIALSGIRSLVTFNESSASGQASSESGVEIDAEKTLALRRYLFALALAAAADTGIWDLREGCILVRKSSKALTAHKVKYSGEEEPFTVPTADEAQGYLEAAARAFFDEKESDGKKVPALPPPLVLAFDPVGARAAVSTKGEPKKKGERKKKPSELKRPSEEANRESASETGGDSEREDAAGESASGEGRGEN